MARMASGQHNTRRRHQPTIASSVFTGLSPRFLDATLTHTLERAEAARRLAGEARVPSGVVERRGRPAEAGGAHAALAIVGEHKPQPDEYKNAADAAIEPCFDGVVCGEAAAEPRGRPCDEQIPNRTVQIEDRAQK
jgi:hypothetical protein